MSAASEKAAREWRDHGTSRWLVRKTPASSGAWLAIPPAGEHGFKMRRTHAEAINYAQRKAREEAR